MTERLHFHFHALEKEMATHSSVLAWRIPGMGEPGGLPCMGLHRVGHDWSDLAAAGCLPDSLVPWCSDPALILCAPKKVMACHFCQRIRNIIQWLSSCYCGHWWSEAPSWRGPNGKAQVARNWGHAPTKSLRIPGNRGFCSSGLEEV